MNGKKKELQRSQVELFVLALDPFGLLIFVSLSSPVGESQDLGIKYVRKAAHRQPHHIINAIYDSKLSGKNAVL